MWVQKKKQSQNKQKGKEGRKEEYKEIYIYIGEWEGPVDLYPGQPLWAIKGSFDVAPLMLWLFAARVDVIKTNYALGTDAARVHSPLRCARRYIP